MYLIKLKIEMNMADLIVKIVKATSHPPGHELHRYAASNVLIPRPGQSRNNSDTSKKSSTVPSRSSGAALSNTQVASSAAASPTAAVDVQGWELSKMPSRFDVEDVVDQRKASVAEGSVAPFAAAGFAPVRPAFVRNMSEMTVLEIGAGYLNPSSKEKRMSGDQAPS